MLVKMVYATVKWINTFPPKGGVSDILSPCAIFTGTQLNYATDYWLPFGAYVQVHQKPSLSNGQEAHTIGIICIGLTGNIQGSYEFLNLRMGKKITCRNWTSLPMLQDVIDRVNALDKANGITN